MTVVSATPTPAATPLRRRHMTSPTLSPVAKKIAPYAPGGSSSFTGTYQAKALKYVQSFSNANSLSTAKAVQYYALACIYYATYAVANHATNAVESGVTPSGWTESVNWLSKTVDPCKGNSSTYYWYGVLCADDNKITTLDLHKNQLTGGIPNEIALLSSSNPSGAGKLRYLDVGDNYYLYNSGDTGLAWMGELGPNLGT